MCKVIIYLFLPDFDCLGDFFGRKITIKQEVDYLFADSLSHFAIFIHGLSWQGF